MKAALSVVMAAIVHCTFAAVFTNDGVRLEFDAAGRVASLKECASGRELLRAKRPFVLVQHEKGKYELPSSFACEGSRLRYFFAKSDSRLEFDIEKFDGGWTFTFAESDKLENAKEICVCDLAPVCTNYLGVYANMFSDDASGVCLRAYDLSLGMAIDRGGRMWIRVKSPLEGLRFGLVAGRRGELMRKLKAMTDVAGVARNRFGGAWALGAQENRASYLQPIMKSSAVDRWIDLAERGGFGTIHLRNWMETYGHYEPKRNLYPGGWDDFFGAVEKIKAAGIKVGVHTLTACVSPQDQWIAQGFGRDLLAWCSYELACDINAEEDFLEVTEPPKMAHDTVFTYFGNGNALRIGNEIVQYSAFTKTAPYRYTGLKRGAFGTLPEKHSKGDAVDYLQQRYRAFYPRPDSELANLLAKQIAWFVNKGGFNQVYFDGSEGMMSREGNDAMRSKIFAAIGRDIVLEASSLTPHSWWQHSRLGAWDGANFDFKPFFDLHEKHASKIRLTDMLETQMGWWLFRDQWLQRRGQFIDDVEYFAAHNAGMDSSMSFMEVDVNDAPLSLYRENAVTMLGWYERFRLARAFDEKVLSSFRIPTKEFRLRQNDGGEWMVQDVDFAETTAAISSGHDHRWSVQVPEKCDLEVRIEALYSNQPYDDKSAMTVFAAETAGVVTSAADRVAAKLVGFDSRHGKALAIRLRNDGAPRRDSWVKLQRKMEKDLEPRGRRGFGFWVCGDGSGAILNVQFRMPRAYGGTTADYVFKIDFEGWRYLSSSIRERTAAEAMRWGWEEPIRGYGRYLSELNMLHFAEVNIYFNNLPPERNVTLAFTELRMMDTFEAELSGMELAAGGVKERVPFTLKSGEWASRGADGWKHWSLKGDLLAKTSAVALAPGQGRCDMALSANADGKTPARARICTFAVGDARRALKGGETVRRHPSMAYEAQLGELYSPERGCVDFAPVKIRPGEKARVEFRFVGPVKGGVLSFAGKKFSVKDLAPQEEFLLKIPGVYSGVMKYAFQAESANCRIGAVKRYVGYGQKGEEL